MSVINLRRAISEIVASMLLLLIVVAIGTTLYLYLYSKAMGYQQTLAQELLEEEILSKQQLSVLLVVGYSDTRQVRVVVATGPVPVEVNAVYINNTLATQYSSLKLDSYAVEELQIPSPISLESGDIIYVRIIYGRGFFYIDSSGKVT